MVIAPVVAAVLSTGASAAYVASAIGWHRLASEGRWERYVALYPVYVILAVISTLATAVVTVLADAQLRGESLSLLAAVRLVRRRLPVLLGWSLVSATVGLVLRVLEERLPLGGRVASVFVGLAWSIVSLLVVPVLVLEGTNPFAATRTSGRLVKARWGETLVGSAAVGFAVFVLALPFLLIAAGFFAISVTLGLAVFCLVLIGFLAFGTTVEGVFRTALYRYATDGVALASFPAEDLAGALWRRGSRSPAQHRPEDDWSAH